MFVLIKVYAFFLWEKYIFACIKISTMRHINIWAICLLYTFSTLIGNGQVCQTLNFKSISVPSKQTMGETTFLLSGKKMYEVGCINGTFPVDTDWQMERGIWCQPIKLLSSIDYSIIENETEWKLSDACEFAYRFYETDFMFEKEDLRIIRTDMVAETQPAMFSVLTFKNESNKMRTLKLRLSFHIDLRPSKRCASLKDFPFNVYIKDEMLVAHGSHGALAIGNTYKPITFVLQDSVAVMEYELSLSEKSKSAFPILIVGDNLGNVDKTLFLHRELLSQYVQERKSKKDYYEQSVLGGTTFECSDSKLTNAFYSAKANVLLNLADHSPYMKQTFIRAGTPYYSRLFGTDFCFSVRGLLASGFHALSRDVLLAIADYAREHLRAPHEISGDGILLGWDHIQVSPQFITACNDYYAWTSDRTFLMTVYPLCCSLISDIFSKADKDKDGFIEGHGLMEESEFREDWEELSASSYIYPALKSLSDMAKIMGDSQISGKYRKIADDYSTDFNRVWWNKEENIWNCAFSASNEGMPYHFWSVIFPQKSGVANVEYGIKAMKRIEHDWVNDQWGMVGRFRPEADQENEGVGIVHNNLCATAAFDYGLPEFGWKLLNLTSKSVFDLNNSCLGLFPECQPGLCTNISQLWSYGTFLETILQGLAGIEVNAVDGFIDIEPAFPEDLEYLSVNGIRVNDENLSLYWTRKRDGKIFLSIRYSGNLKEIHVSEQIEDACQVEISQIE